ncbi:zinc finger homeobox protein 2 isoform X1 [Hylobates moloch]|uniref:zinc finger homeobox protein 2 isoform X1 n=1 Tax=Hylobates moloch TaxID=81572 RepID=UPI002675BFD4|nr:zinc finger homeobox protein 2 isoform X1 [Hylobates moloch]XP_058285192.1 zinc finger homeobox protein 2 isoform X1 [Hylobates moloch]XP_058285193.1 zinc finger homeobox protein 2 isoform X1 [Hylobates moloch]XP_058285194.1 zinc finger homeobox protein 2 isoform X1 [Hylobates moloch]XP_058285195.1 zinc finger homeobox protein 2 isoform X1 [Hylobates moloch]XP_058285196.1 zinc finger homeobox protein 2 isoform X1 [Hylobates moloch]XP_058285197.1 zinc finger homeobox protein 2 isoform X1 [H
MATLNSASTTGTTPSPGHNAPSLPSDTSSSSTPSGPVTKDPPAASSTSENMRSSEPGGQPLESSCGLVPPKEIGEPQGGPDCSHFPPNDPGVENDKEQEEEEEGLPPVDLSNHLFFTAGGEAYLVAKLSLPDGSELLLPKGFPWGEVGIKEEPNLPFLAYPSPSHLTALHIQHGFDPIQGFSSSDQILSHDTSAPSPAACEERHGAFWSYQLAPNPPGDPKDGPMGNSGGNHVAVFWLCLLCRLGFSKPQAFMGHTQSHGVKLTPAQYQGLSGSPAVLQEGDEGCKALISFLEPKVPARPSSDIPLDNNSTVNMEANVAQMEDGPPEAEVQALVLLDEEVMALSPPSPPTATWDPSPTQAKESPVAAGEAGPDWFPEGQEEDGGLCPPLNQSSPTSKEGGTLPAPVGSPEDPSDPPQPYRLADDYTLAPAAFQGLSLSSHMSLLHSRNSCKTLKCPKCNWHYKYQQTLDVHMREKHPESNSHCSYCSAGGAHPRLARGESYNCGYKPYRCDVCNYSTTTKGNLSIHMQSDKHLANLQGFQAGPGGQGSPPEASLPPSAGDKEPKTKSSWQCKVCSYETNISRNLRIHMTSEKHMQNVLMLHQGLPLGLPPGLMGPGPPPPPGATRTSPPELFQYFGPQALGQPQTPLPGPGLRPDKPLEAQLLLNGFHHPGAPARKFPTSAPGSLSPDAHLPPSQLLGSSSDSLPTSPPPDDSPSLKVFRCLVCQAFSTDSLELLLYHCSIGRSLPEAEWKEVAGDTHRCKLCCYGTQLKANFQLHLKTDKHAQKYQLAAHLREGGGAMGTPSPVSVGDGAPYGSVSPLHLRCNICDFESNSKEKMQLHARGAAHKENSQIYKFLLDMEGAEAGAELGLYHCLLCAWETPSRLAVLQHLRTPAHRDAQAQRRLQLLQNGPTAEEGLAALQSILSFSHGQLRTPGKAPVTPLAEPPTPEKDAQNKTEQLASEETENKTGPSRDSANQTTVRTGVYCCPYCSFMSPESSQVRAHTLSQHAMQPKYRCPLCQEQLVGRPALHFHLSHLHNVVPECVEKLLLVATTVEMTFTTKVLSGPTLSPLDDGQEPPTRGPEPTPSRDQAAEGPNLTPEASPDPLPEPPLASAEAPDKPSGSPGQPSSPAPSPVPQPDAQAEDIAPLPTMAEEEEGTTGELRSAEPAPADSRHPLTYRKTTNFALDKFLDPARPFKCTVCKESFTQKNILLVHYNSVSHLHKMKKAATDPSAPARGEAGAPPTTTAATDKPFKCTVCRVSYNQSSTLEIHMRSVLHQTRSRGTKSDSKIEGPERSQEEPKEGETEGEVGTEKKGPDTSGFVSGLPFLSPPLPPLDLHRFPAPLFTPPVLPPFPLVPESLLKLQQQQLLLPFYLHDLKVGPKLTLAGPAPVLSLPAATPPPPPQPPKAELAEREWERPPMAKEGNEAGPSSPPDPLPNEAARTAAKALLENFGFELVIQYNEGKQAVPPPPIPPPPEALGGGDKLACGACGKLFSNMLILKTHEEHVHRRFLPFEALSRYAAQFRKSYDSLYPPLAEPPKPPDGSLDSPAPHLGPPFLVPEPEAGGTRAPEEQSRAGGHWPIDEEESSGGNLPPLVPAGRRFSRTKFTEFQTQALQSFFETSAYPKDGEVERLASLLGLASRVVVVWFQNARQKARKNACEGGSMPTGGGTGGASGCRRCHATFSCVFELVRHLKKCYDDQTPEEEEEEAERGEEEEEVEEEVEEEQGLEPPAGPEGPLPEPPDGEELSQAEATKAGGKEPEEKATPSPSPAHTCDQCAISFSSQDLLTSHRRLHFLPSLQPSAPPQLLDLPLLVFGERNPLVAATSPMPGPPLKRKHEDGSLSPTGSEAGGGGEGEPPRDKRLRTTILPEQLEILYRWYMQDSNPTRKMLDCISEEVGLKKRVVQVWFQNTRARERKGQFRSTPGGVPSPAVKPPATATPASLPKFNLLLGKVDDGTGREAPKREAPAFPYPTATLASGPQPFLPPGKEATTPTPEPPLPLLPPPPPSEEEGPEEPPKASPESEACSLSAGDLSDSSASSLAEPESPGAGGTSGGPGGGTGVPDGMGQRRYRTQMSSLQLKIMKACYEAYRTPTMQECEVLGEEIGLPKRVIQVWFQNARAKEKKAKLQGTAAGSTGGSSEGPLAAQRTDCPYCDVKYDFYVSCRGHLFSRQHLAKLKEAVRAQLKSESKCYDLAPAPEAPPALKAPPATTPASMPLGAAPTLPRLAPVLLSGPALAQPPLGNLAPFNSGPAASSGLLGLATSVLPTTTMVQTAGPGHPLPQRPMPDQTNTSTAGTTDPVPGPPTEPLGDKVSGERQPVAAPTSSSNDALKNLKALKTTVPALLGGQFLPFPLPPAGGTAPPAVFGPQLQGAYFQQLYGMKKGLFPMNPMIPQTLIGLLPNALLQPPPQPPEPTATAPPKPPELPTPGEGEAGEVDELLTGSTGISTVDVTHRYLCRQCKMAFDGEALATAHQRSFCFFGRGSGGSMPPPLRVPICTYHCLACEVLLSGREALASHLRSSAHRRKAAPPQGGPPISITNAATAASAAVAFAKEEARLPHTDSNPKTTTTSTLLAL